MQCRHRNEVVTRCKHRNDMVSMLCLRVYGYEGKERDWCKVLLSHDQAGPTSMLLISGPLPAIPDC
jgi:hypothetical protein